MNIERKCAYCGKTYYITEHRLNEIQSKGHESNYCSKLCLFEARKKFEMRKCLNCGAEFYPADNETRFCSTHCAHTYNRKKYTSIPADYFESLLKKYRKNDIFNLESRDTDNFLSYCVTNLSVFLLIIVCTVGAIVERKLSLLAVSIVLMLALVLIFPVYIKSKKFKWS